MGLFARLASVVRRRRPDLPVDSADPMLDRAIVEMSDGLVAAEKQVRLFIAVEQRLAREAESAAPALREGRMAELAEARRTVEKLQAGMGALCDQLEAAKQRRAALHLRGAAAELSHRLYADNGPMSRAGSALERREAQVAQKETDAAVSAELSEPALAGRFPQPQKDKR